MLSGSEMAAMLQQNPGYMDLLNRRLTQGSSHTTDAGRHSYVLHDSGSGNGLDL